MLKYDIKMSLLEQSEILNSYLSQWREENRRGAVPVELLNKIADLLDNAATAYVQLEPDPFDDRHPVYSNPDGVIGHLLKTIYDDDEFFSKVLTSYIFNADNNFDLNCVATRIIINMTPAINGPEIFEPDTESSVSKLLSWAQNEKEPLRSYSLGLLCTAMIIPECPALFKDKNAILYPICVRRLKLLSTVADQDCPAVEDFDYLQRMTPNKTKTLKRRFSHTDTTKYESPSMRKRRSSVKDKSLEYKKADLSLAPLSVATQQKLILKYLHPMGEYQELLGVAFEEDVIDLIFHYINIKKQNDSSTACGALLVRMFVLSRPWYNKVLSTEFDHTYLNKPAVFYCRFVKWLSSLLCHKKFIVEFIERGGIQHILEIPQPSVVATMSSLCLYYMAYSEDAVERICLLPHGILQQLTEYLLWLLECSHISGRCHASLFFSMTFSFRSILTLFDSYDGLRKVINMHLLLIDCKYEKEFSFNEELWHPTCCYLMTSTSKFSTLKIMRVEESDLTTDDDVFLDREMAKNACLTLRKYYEAHIINIAQEYRRITARQYGRVVPAPNLPYRPVVSTPDELQDHIEYIQNFVSSAKILESAKICVMEKQLSKRSTSLNVAPLFLKLIVVASDWKNYNSRSDVMVSTLEILTFMSSSRKIAVSFCQQIEIRSDDLQSGIYILLRAVDGELVTGDVQVQKAALQCICNCVCTNAKAVSEEGTVSVISSKEKNKELVAMQKLWTSVRLNNGIKILLSLLNIKTPITEADSIRALVCKALCGLSDDDLIRQVFGKLPLFHNEQLQIMMREPILSDKMDEHIKFCKSAKCLIEKVTGKPLRNDHGDSIPMLSKITKADIIAQTKITYPQKELLTVIHKHLKAQGLTKAADALKDEAQLTLTDAEKRPSNILGTPFLSLRESQRESLTLRESSSSSTSTFARESVSLSALPKLNGSMTSLEPVTPHRKQSLVFTSPFSSPQLEKRINLKARKSLSSSCYTPSGLSSTIKSINIPTATGSVPLKEKFKRQRSRRPVTPPSLDSIVTDYLREQHARCTNPVATCPPFSLLRPHRCPEPRYRNYASTNITKRLYAQQSGALYGGFHGRKHNRRYLHSRFRSNGCIKEQAEDNVLTCCAWIPDNSTLCCGTQTGDVKMYSFYDGQEEALLQCHGAPISTIFVAKNYQLMTTSASYGTPSGSVWSIKRDEKTDEWQHELQLELTEDNFVQFSTSEERVIGTEDVTAHVWDLTSGTLIRTFYDQRNANNYHKNFACFGPGDELLLNDGCLWDVRMKDLVHKFDKFNDYVSGVFNPNGLEIIINSEVWDIRTFHLLDTCPALDQNRIIFTNNSDVVYGVKHISSDDTAVEHSGMLGPYDTSFRTFDAVDYTPIATIDTKKTIFDIAHNPLDQVIAVIESSGNLSSLDIDTNCRFYDIGRIKRAGDDDSDDESQEDNTEGSQGSQEIENLLNNFFDDFDNEDDDDNDDDDDDDTENDSGNDDSNQTNDDLNSDEDIDDDDDDDDDDLSDLVF